MEGVFLSNTQLRKIISVFVGILLGLFVLILVSNLREIIYPKEEFGGNDEYIEMSIYFNNTHPGLGVRLFVLLPWIFGSLVASFSSTLIAYHRHKRYYKMCGGFLCVCGLLWIIIAPYPDLVLWLCILLIIYPCSWLGYKLALPLLPNLNRLVS